MLRLGEKQTLIVEKTVRMGVFLSDRESLNGAEPEEGSRRGERRRERGAADAGKQMSVEHVLLPSSQVPPGTKPGDALEVFLYKDSEDRLIATRKEPRLTLHQVGFLTVRETGRIGAFLDWGLDKDLLLPFREQPRDHRVQKGESVLCAVYIDKSGRLAATMNVYPYLRADSPYQAGDEVTGTAYETSDNFGLFVAVDNIYSALIPKRELVRPIHTGETVEARVMRVREDGRLDLSLRGKAWQTIGDDAEAILARMKENGGVLPFTDKADPELIRREMGMSKAQFKRAVGHLLKEGSIEIGGEELTLTS